MNIEAEDDDDLLNELDHELKNTQTSKVSFKKKSSTSHKNPNETNYCSILMMKRRMKRRRDMMERRITSMS